MSACDVYTVQSTTLGQLKPMSSVPRRDQFHYSDAILYINVIVRPRYAAWTRLVWALLHRLTFLFLLNLFTCQLNHSCLSRVTKSDDTVLLFYEH